MQTLVTGGAGFIGSHLVDALVADGHQVRVLDDLSTGAAANVDPAAELVEGDVAVAANVARAVAGAEVVFHQAARGSVQRSVEDPLATDRVNIHGTLTVLAGALEAGARRVVHASSSSVYGGAGPLPTPESAPVVPRSPYAVTKAAAEQYCRVFAELHGLETVALRYFNVFGPRQRADSAYAAVIPRFIDHLRRGEAPTVHGDGRQSRDFTFVSDVVAANQAAAAAPAERCAGRVYNIAGGRDRSLLELLDVLAKILDVRPEPHHGEPRAGDIRHSRAEVAAAAADLGFHCQVDFATGLAATVGWFATPRGPAGP
ncbi:MAG TPA: NAD-dependent epimerase/dehydratase family protein [Acidimicrobiales bacterium]|nr:NAD-dependent epimerase/dehydratase family protein [Acidimicrobiales bacterium]